MSAGNKKVIEGGVPIPFDLRLRSLRSTRQTYARILRCYGRGTIDEQVYRATIYGLTNYLAYLRTEHEFGIVTELEKRLDILEGEAAKRR